MAIGLAPTQTSKFEVHKIDGDLLSSLDRLPLPFHEGVTIRGYSAINQPNCQIIIEDFFPGEDFSWTFVHDEFQYAISGEVELTVYLPPLYSEVVKAHITPGTVYTFPVGARMDVKVIGNEPYRHICFCPPSPNYPFPTYQELKKG